MFEIVTKSAAKIWSKAVQNLPSHILKFALNAVQDTLPHNANLQCWRKLSDACKLCGKRQTLLHILNNCPVALNSRRYNQRHDLVLTIISDFLRATLTEDYKIVSDLATPENYLFPPVLAITDLRPDLVVYNELMRDAIIIELTVPFESNSGKAQERKQGKYHGLMNDVKKNG